MLPPSPPHHDVHDTGIVPLGLGLRFHTCTKAGLLAAISMAYYAFRTQRRAQWRFYNPVLSQSMSCPMSHSRPRLSSHLEWCIVEPAADEGTQVHDVCQPQELLLDVRDARNVGRLVRHRIAHLIPASRPQPSRVDPIQVASID